MMLNFESLFGKIKSSQFPLCIKNDLLYLEEEIFFIVGCSIISFGSIENIVKSIFLFIFVRIESDY